MITVNPIILVLFRFINFGVFIAIGWYVFKRYGLPQLEQDLADYRAYFEGLWNTHRHLKKEQQWIEQSLSRDHKEQNVLKERLMRWRASVDDQNKKKVIEKEECIKKLKMRTLEQQKRINEQRIFKEVLAQAIEQARGELNLAAKEQDMQHKTLDTIVSKICKS